MTERRTPATRIGTIGTLAVIVAITTVTALTVAAPPGPSFDDRVEAQRAIERVYWEQRVWPDDAARPKPPLESVVSDATLGDKVRDYMRKSRALEDLWNRPIGADQLQAELDRMVATTRAPETLGRLFAALDHDPGLIAETLVRQVLADRLVRNWYARDPELHRVTGEQARLAIGASRAVDDWAARGGIVRTSVWVLPGERTEATRSGGDEQVLDAATWATWSRDLAGRVGAGLPVDVWSDLMEEGDGFEVVAVTAKGAGRIEVTTVSWPKRGFESWWTDARESMAVELEAPAGPYAVTVPLAAAGCTSDTWRDLADVPAGRMAHTAVWTGSEMIVWGGGFGLTADGMALDRGGIYDPATDWWRPVTTAGAPEPRRQHTAVWTGSEMIVWGGRANPEIDLSLASGGRYDPVTDTWQPTSTVGAPQGREDHTATWTGSEMIVWGGLDHATGSWLASGARYDPDLDTWTPLPAGGAPSARADHTAVWTGSEMVVWGGEGDGGSSGTTGPPCDCCDKPSQGTLGCSSCPPCEAIVCASDPWCCSVDWDGVCEMTAETDCTCCPGQDPGGCSGDDGCVLQTGARYAPDQDSWSPLTVSALTPEARKRHTAVWTGSRMIVWGGMTSIDALAGGGGYDPSTDTWTAIASTAEPAARTGHTAVWTGGEMVVWGGENAGIEVDTGGRYDPLTDDWAPTAPAAAPARSGHTAVWTGSEMIVWGGGDKSLALTIDYLDSGGRYDPATDTWVGTEASARPVRRAWHSAVWTGSEMIVWGGFYYGGSYQTSGGRYDPATASWTPTALLRAPEGRRNHTAVWSGTEMIVWGGYEVNATVGLFYHQGGGRYDPIADAWIPTSTAGAPSARAFQTAVWSGSEMLVWGGAAGGMQMMGGRYDPTSNTWTPISTDGAPEPRYKHSAIWTGSRMIVWGGGGESNPRDSGGLYDPATDTWAPTSTVDAPAGRLLHTAVWTGSEMIVWGGQDDGGSGEGLGTYGDGGRYDPGTDSWATMSEDGAPGPRTDHRAVWTGSHLIVFGGRSAYRNQVDTGGLYHAATDGWSPMSDVLAPMPRAEHTAVWSGSEMLVFGGERFPVTFWGDGSRFCAADADGDGAMDAQDCAEDDGSTWAPPGEIHDLALSGAGPTLITWEMPEESGSTAVRFDVLRSEAADDFTGASCVAADASDPVATDAATPAAGQVFYYLVSAKNDCGSSQGTGSDGAPRTWKACN